MKILSVEKYKGDTYLIEIEGNDNSRLYLNKKIVSEFNIAPGNIPETALSEIISADNIRKARERALYLLDVRDYSFTGLYEKLIQNYPDEICMEVCGLLASNGLINDMRYAENKARQLFEVKYTGVYKARQEMKLKGLSEDVINAAIEPYSERESVLNRLPFLLVVLFVSFLVCNYLK